jgi:hypothetical protein
VDALGSDIRERLTLKWAEAHGATLAQALERRFFAELLGQLDTQVSDWARTASALSETTWRISS